MSGLYYFKNYDSKTIELYFPGVPSYKVRAELKQSFWRYNPNKQCWFAPLNVSNESLAKSLGATDETSDQNAYLKSRHSPLDQISDDVREKLKSLGLASMDDAQIKDFLSSLDGPAPTVVSLAPLHSDRADGMVVTLFSVSGKMIPIGITTDVTQQNSEENIFWINRSISNAIIKGIIRQKPWVLFRGEPCLIAFYADTQLLQKIRNHSAYFMNEDSLAEIWIYSLKMPCHEHPKDIEMVTAYIPAVNSFDIYPINVYHCPICNKYYINAEQYQSYAKRHGLPHVRLMFTRNGNGNIDFSAWRNESPIHIMGYNVGSVDNLSSEARRQTLLHILNTDTMKKHEIISFLEFLIHKNAENLRFENACSKWREDVEFLRNYNTDGQRKVIGRFKVYE